MKEPQYTPEAKMLMMVNEHAPVYKTLFACSAETVKSRIEEDASLLRKYHEAYIGRAKMQVGDWARTKDGRMMQVTVCNSDTFQAFGDGQHYCYLGEYTSYSGICGESYNKSDFVLTRECKPGSCWFFHGGLAGAHKGVDAVMPFKVWQEL